MSSIYLIIQEVLLTSNVSSKDRSKKFELTLKDRDIFLFVQKTYNK